MADSIAQSPEKKSWRDALVEEVRVEWTDTILLLGCFATGLLDSAVFNTWSCFVSMQTGNTVYVGLGMTGQPHSQPTRWIKSGVSVIAFLLGAFLFSRQMSAMGATSRRSLLTASALQALLTLAAALIATFAEGIDESLRGSYIVLLPLALLALQSGGQCVLSRVLGFGEVPSVVVTASYCDLAMDPKLVSMDNPKRNRRVLSGILLLAGAGLGGLLTRDGLIEWALWPVLGIKTAMCLIWFIWPAKRGIQLD